MLTYVTKMHQANVKSFIIYKFEHWFSLDNIMYATLYRLNISDKHHVECHIIVRSYDLNTK